MYRSPYSNLFRLMRKTQLNKHKIPSQTTPKHLNNTQNLTSKTNNTSKSKDQKPKHKAYKLNKIDIYPLQYKAQYNPLKDKKKRKNLRINLSKIKAT